MKRVWWAQIKAVIRLELRKTFFARRGLWIYFLALLPVLLFVGYLHRQFTPDQAEFERRTETARSTLSLSGSAGHQVRNDQGGSHRSPWASRQSSFIGRSTEMQGTADRIDGRPRGIPLFRWSERPLRHLSGRQGRLHSHSGGLQPGPRLHHVRWRVSIFLFALGGVLRLPRNLHESVSWGDSRSQPSFLFPRAHAPRSSDGRKVSGRPACDMRHLRHQRIASKRRLSVAPVSRAS